MARLLAALITGALALAWAPSVSADTPASAFARLRQMGVVVALPDDVPPGFTLKRVVGPKAWAGPAFAPHYLALYEGPKGAGFAIESAGSDLGASAAWDERPHAIVRALWFPRAGEIGLHWRGPRANMARSWVSDWIEGPEQYYRLIGPAHVRNEHGLTWAPTRELDFTWAVRVLVSIRPVGATQQPQPRGQAEMRPFYTEFQQDRQWKDIRTVPVR